MKEGREAKYKPVVTVAVAHSLSEITGSIGLCVMAIFRVTFEDILKISKQLLKVEVHSGRRATRGLTYMGTSGNKILNVGPFPQGVHWHRWDRTTFMFDFLVSVAVWCA